ncbi:PucR family transcriptional regulator [Actinomadura sediminis]|uniref:PucR family transcriptional regulator n=1 Tax=Actinomadura sediminis TaxID=1038904 RepID=A0ABW3ESL1_9ACTN
MPPSARPSVLDVSLPDVSLLAAGVDAGSRDRLLGGLRKGVPDAARDAVRAIERELPVYVRPHDARYVQVLTISVERAIGHFVDLLGDPDLPSDAVTEHFRRIGAGEAGEGRGLEALQAAFRIGAGVAIRRLTEEAQRQDVSVTSTAVARVTQAVLGHIDRLAAAAAEGHAERAARQTGGVRARRRALLEGLLEPGTGPEDVRLLAADCEWPVPRTVAAVALSAPPGGRAPRPALPPDVLVGLHLDDPCLVVPDPDGPGRRRALETAMAGWDAAIGPTVPVARCALSLRLARQALLLAHDGVIAARRPIAVVDHIPMTLLGQSPELASLLVERKLRPLLRSPRRHARHKLAETFLACIESNFNANQVAARMDVHAQTVRHRLRQLEALFGEDLHDPAQRLEFHLALRAWIASGR